jgi:sugar lactone lactonase YvrE
MSVRSSSLIALCSLVAACSKPVPTPVSQPGEAPPVAPVTVETMPASSSAPAASAQPALQEATKPPPSPVPAPVLTFKGMLATPESVLYDPAGDRYLVSNVNGKPDAADGNGFISELSPDGSVKNAKWIAGGVNKVKLDAPKGSAIVRGELWVADITVVRKFDLKTGAPKGDVVLPAASFANDVVLAPDGRVFVSDSGVKVGEKGLESNGGDQVFSIDKAGKVKVLAKSKDLSGPNGLQIGPKGLLVNTLNAAEIYHLTDAGVKEGVIKVPNGGLDGLLVLGDTVWVSSWGASAVYRGKLGGTLEPVVQNVSGPADIGWDSKRSRLLVPRFVDDAVEVYEVK